MTTRRMILVCAALLPIGVALAKRPAPRPKAPVAGSVLDAKTRAPLTVLKTGVFSISNANDRYTAVAELTTLPTDGPILFLGATELKAGSWGSGFGTGAGDANWEIDQATADQIAALWKVKRADRTPLGAGLAVSWRAKQPSFRRGKPMIVIATLANKGSDKVGVQIGGRQFGRDEHFAFTASKGGNVLPVIDPGPQAGGGGFYYKVLAPGDTVDLEVDVAGWIKITKPGTYQLGCTYVTDLVPDKKGPQWPDHGAETWDLSLSGPLTVKVK